MKSNQYLTLLLIPLLALCAKSYGQNELPLLEGPYMGQKTPGVIAEPFAPGIISTNSWELEGVFAPGMKEFYFTIDRVENSRYASAKANTVDTSKKRFIPTVIGFRQENNRWKKHTEFKRKGEVSFSPDGKRMHMAKTYRDRLGDKWSENKKLEPMFNRKDWGIMRLSASAEETYVFDDYKHKNSIRISRLKDGVRQTPEKMPPEINSGDKTAHPFIAPDESYLIWDSKREGGFGDSDLYISFLQADDSWGAAINMGPQVNSDKADFFATVTPDGKYILFNRTILKSEDHLNVDIYWVDAQIIETLRAKQ